MKRTDFTQNFPGGIIKGDSRCREGEEMEEKIDLNVCYRKAFEALGITGSVQKFADYITEYAPVVLIVLDIGGKILAMSHKGGYNETLLPEDMDSKRRVELISQMIEYRSKESGGKSMLIHVSEEYYAVNEIVVKGDAEGFVISILDTGIYNAKDAEETLIQMNDIVCQGLGMLMERQEQHSHSHISTIRRVIARLLFEGEGKQLLNGTNDIYNEYVVAPFRVAVVRAEVYNSLQLQKAANYVSDVYENVFVYIEEQYACLLFTDIHTEECRDKICKVMDNMCEKYKLLCCLSGSFNEIELIDKKRFMCQKALEIAHEQEPDKRSFREEDYYVQIVCSCALPYIGHARYLERELTELASEDEAKETKFYETLKQYLLVGNNVSMAAKKMFIHRNTMIYRLSKINEILGVDINEPGIAHKILISILLREQEKEEK